MGGGSFGGGTLGSHESDSFWLVLGGLDAAEISKPADWMAIMISPALPA